MKKIFTKNKIYLLILIIIFVMVILISKNYRSKLTINLKELYQNNTITQINKNSKLLPILPENLQEANNNSYGLTTTQNIEDNKSTIKDFNPDNTQKISIDQDNIKVDTIYCQDIRNKFPIFWIKKGALYGEILNKGIKLSVILKDDCLWVWSSGKKNGLKVCSANINLDFLNNIDLDNIDKKSIEKIQEKIPNFNCSKEYVKESRFLPPSNIEFFLITDENKNLF